MRVLSCSLVVVFVLISASACSYSDTVRASMIGISDFKEVKPDLYISPRIASNQENAIAELISNARSRIADKFGAPMSSPKIIVSKGEKELRNFKLYKAPGKVLIAPWGNYILLNHELANVDVAAHELVHAEIAYRLGYFVRMKKMPTWLDEGIALQVDYRPAYSNLSEIDDSELNRVFSLDSPKSFWTEDEEQNVKNYQSSKEAVRTRVLPVIEEKGLYEFLEEIRTGSSLEGVVGN